eukprot:SAG22_NODE_19494_length_274_cov_0.885714_1_plen_36_part_01
MDSPDMNPLVVSRARTRLGKSMDVRWRLGNKVGKQG